MNDTRTPGISAPVNVLVVGAGMYVCGRGTDGWGTILPTLACLHREGRVGEVAVASAHRASVAALQQRLAALNEQFGTNLRVRTYPASDQEDPYAYRRALADLSPPACAIVAVPDALHTPVTLDVIQAGLHALVVKPLAPTVREVDSLLGALRGRRLHAVVEFHKRLDEANLIIRERLRRGEIGEISYVLVQFSQRRTIPLDVFRSWAHTTSVFQYLGVHYVDLIHYLSGALPTSVVALGQRGLLERQGVNTYDSIHALVEWRSRRMGRTFLSNLATGWVDPDGSSALSEQRLTVVGTDGRIDSDQKGRGLELASSRGFEEINPYFCQAYEGAGGRTGLMGYGPRSIRQFILDVQDVLEGKVDPEDLAGRRPSFLQARISTAVLEAVRISLERDGARVPVDVSESFTASVRPGGVPEAA